jgi:hypothetical protein
MNGWLSRAAQRLEKIIFPISHFLHLIGQVMLVLMVSITVADVFLRYVLNRPILGSYELTEFMMAILVFASVGYTMTVKGHVVVGIWLPHGFLKGPRLLSSASPVLSPSSYLPSSPGEMFYRRGSFGEDMMYRANYSFPLAPLFYS